MIRHVAHLILWALHEVEDDTASENPSPLRTPSGQLAHPGTSVMILVISDVEKMQGLVYVK